MPRLALALAIVAISTAAPLVRWAAPAPALLVASARTSLTAIVLLFVARRDLATVVRLPARDRALCALSGLLLGAHFGVWVTSLYYTSTAASVAIVATQPVFAGLLGWLALGEAMRRREIAGVAVAALGCAILAGVDLAGGGTALRGDALALGGAFTAAAYFVVGRRLRAALPLAAYLAAVNAVAAAVLIAAAAAARVPVGGFAPSAYVAIALTALVPSLVGHTLLNWAVRRVPVHLVALAILGEPIGASIISWIAFGERPPAHAALGGAVILGGIALGFTRAPRAPPSTARARSRRGAA